MTRNNLAYDPSLRSVWDEEKQLASKPRTYQGKTLTPLYGGGVVAGVVDKEMPVRSSGIRGQLRFWWRLLYGKGLTSQECFARERALWGGIGDDGPAASSVRVRVRATKSPKLQPAFKYAKNSNGEYKASPEVAKDLPAYALFPAQGELDKTDKRVIAKQPSEITEPGIEFSLEIDCPPERWTEVETALRWWASFGGLGARTRRGLGAVELEGINPISREEVEKAGGRLELMGGQLRAQEAWNQAINRLKSFRQGEGVGRNNGQQSNHPGRSRWPEPDMIRRLSSKHRKHPPVHPVEGLYPRAAFGLPIIFHFKPGAGDPSDHCLEPSGEYDRMASPLILRPYPLGNRNYAAAALLIPGWESALKTKLKVKNTRHDRLTTWPKENNKRQDAAGKILPMKGLGDDPLSAFMAFFAQGGR
ncbi:MAG: type III-B CRISPR module RAMP protein Cmr1 [Gammaproteobacteria bacterium]|nr:type III-B CRISPR module RAMP protein Cmr1 [Gammaproteobacteria bacterium]MBU1655992.1 type III-B CRISPR module RAMP protein Cmr1 [Gammaproteobacteria bacterium]MBU1962576.1 type III-B CRISPR module RAMP protein Cmr1 [Gammaproteobacteria bacterium]